MFQRQIDVYRLDPNTTYVFKIWASNELGPGEESVLEATTLHDIEEIGKKYVQLWSLRSATHSPFAVFSVWHGTAFGVRFYNHDYPFFPL